MDTKSEPDRAEKDRFLRLPEVTRRVGMVCSTIYQKIAEGQFPAPVKLGPRLAFWLESEIQDWQNRVIALGRQPREPHPINREERR